MKSERGASERIAMTDVKIILFFVISELINRNSYWLSLVRHEKNDMLDCRKAKSFEYFSLVQFREKKNDGNARKINIISCQVNTTFIFFIRNDSVD